MGLRDSTDQSQISLAYLPPTPRQARSVLAGAGVDLDGDVAQPVDAGEPRLRAVWTVCIIDFATFKSTPIPEDLRGRMRAYLT